VGKLKYCQKKSLHSSGTKKIMEKIGEVSGGTTRQPNRTESSRNKSEAGDERLLRKKICKNPIQLRGGGLGGGDKSAWP